MCQLPINKIFVYIILIIQNNSTGIDVNCLFENRFKFKCLAVN